LLGEPARQVIAEDQATAYADALLKQMDRRGVLVPEPLLDAYLFGLAQRLIAAWPGQLDVRHTVVLDDDDINAFSALGGLIAINSGLILATESESELAAVMAHELAHNAQLHVQRAHEDASSQRWLMLAGVLAAAIAGGDAGKALALGAAAGSSQLTVNQIRRYEFEADRLGIEGLARAGFDPEGYARFLELMARQEPKLPDFAQPLLTHPVSSTRLAEARAAARRLAPGADAPQQSLSDFRCARLWLEAAHLSQAKGREQMQSGYDPDEHSYRAALAALMRGNAEAARRGLAPLAARYPDHLWIGLALIDAQIRLGDPRADASARALLALYPGQWAVFARALDARIAIDPAAALALAQSGLRQYPFEARLYQRLARLAADQQRPDLHHEAAAGYFLLRGEPRRARLELLQAQLQPNLTPTDQQRLDALIRELDAALALADS